jgi:pimeloyl-ACP methyl ester carboxylesterase
VAKHLTAASCASSVRSLCCGTNGDRAAALAGRRTRRSQERFDAGERFEAWWAAALASDPVGSKQEPPVLRSPAGVFQDDRNYWDAGKAYYNPERIKIPTLVVIAEWDQVTPSQGAQALFHKLPSGPNKRLVEIGEGTHFVMLEKNRMQLFQEVQRFLEKARGSN